jgi:four helix bundle protein
MPLDHERLDVYRLALDFVVLANEVIKTLPRGRSHLADQLTRASTSIVLNIAEGDMLVRLVSMLIKLAQACEV